MSVIMALGVVNMTKPKFTGEHIEHAYDMLKNATKDKPVTSEEIRKEFDFKIVSGRPNERALIKEVMKEARPVLVITMPPKNPGTGTPGPDD